MRHPDTRDTLYCERAELLEHQALQGDQHCLRLCAPLTAAHAKPGNFVHLRCSKALALPRPMSIMRADKQAHWIELLYRTCGDGTAQLTEHRVGDAIDLIGPIGNSFKISDHKKYPLLIAGGLGLPPLIFLAEYLRKQRTKFKPLVLVGSERPFPFSPEPSQIVVSGIPEYVTAASPLLESWGIASRLCSLHDQPGCYHGYVSELAEHWLAGLDEDLRREVELFGCGPMPMLASVSQIAQRYQLNCQVSLEEYMACGVGGCAGCTVMVETEQGRQMQRVCVDGPVFNSAAVFPVRAAG